MASIEYFKNELEFKSLRELKEIALSKGIRFKKNLLKRELINKILEYEMIKGNRK